MISKRKIRIQIYIFFAAVSLMALVLCGELFPYIKIRPPLPSAVLNPDLVLSASVLTSLITDKKTGAVYGIIFGLLYDTVVGTPFSVSILVCFLGAYFAGMLFESFSRLTLVSALCAAAPIFLLRSTVTFFSLLAYTHKISVLSILVESVLFEYIVNVLFFIPLYFAVKYLFALCDRVFKWKQL